MGVYDSKTGKTKNQMGRTVKGFENAGKNFHLIARRLMENERLLKLLVITSPNADSSSVSITDEQRSAVFGDNIRLIPVIDKDVDMKNYVLIQGGAFTPTDNEMYVNYMITFDVICNVRNWMMEDYTPRPYKIMQEIDDIVKNTKLASMGPCLFAGASNLVINEENAGFSLTYYVVSE